jgi:hypothetical protein
MYAEAFMIFLKRTPRRWPKRRSNTLLQLCESKRPPEQRQQIRTARSRPLLDSLKAWLDVSLTKFSQKSEVTLAIHYAFGRWTQLLSYCGDGKLEIDNNAA